VVVAVVAMRVVEMTGDAIIHVVAVRHRLMATAGSVHMTRLMPTTAMVGGAALGVLARHLEHVLVYMVFVRVVEVAIVQIVRMTAMAHGGMSAARPMLMSMIGMGRRRAGRHGIVSFPCSKTADIAVRLSAAWSMALRINGSTCSSASA
jgi:hypothetical protein